MNLKNIYIILVIFSLSISVLKSQTYEGSILRVLDGDTFIFNSKNIYLKIRMQGIDAPEKYQPFGLESKRFIEKFINEKVKIETHGVDLYGRTIATLYVNGENINLLSVKNGYAWHYKKYSNDKSMASAEKKAKQNKRGLWQVKTAMPPWEWRKKKKVG